MPFAEVHINNEITSKYVQYKDLTKHKPRDFCEYEIIKDFSEGTLPQW